MQTDKVITNNVAGLRAEFGRLPDGTLTATCGRNQWVNCELGALMAAVYLYMGQAQG